MKYKSIQRIDRFTLQCVRADGKSVQVPIESGSDQQVFVEVAAIWAWDSPDSTNLTDDDKEELRQSLTEYFAQQGRKVIFDTGEQSQEPPPSFTLKRLSANVVQCEKDGKTALVSVAKSVDGARLLVGLDRYKFWEPPDERLELSEVDASILMKELAEFLGDGRLRLEFQTEHRRPLSPNQDAAENADGDESDDHDGRQ